MSAHEYKKHFIPLESDPRVFDSLIHSLGALPYLRFQEIYTLEDSSQLPHPAFALILILPTSKAYEEYKALEEDSPQPSLHDNSEITWFKQTINNACGLYAILHAVCNGEGKHFIKPESFLANLINTEPHQRASVLENSDELRSVYTEAAREGSTHVPNPEDEVDFHYVCFVKSSASSPIYELDGDRRGPIIRTGPTLPEDDLLTDVGIQVVRATIDREEDVRFSLMALTAS